MRFNLLSEANAIAALTSMHTIRQYMIPGVAAQLTRGLAHFSGRTLHVLSIHSLIFAGGTGSIGSLIALWLGHGTCAPIFLLGRSGRHPADSPINLYRWEPIFAWYTGKGSPVLQNAPQ